eukprot:scaffold49348_cov46-Phaeocystis_antarctica.AAC.2
METSLLQSLSATHSRSTSAPHGLMPSPAAGLARLAFLSFLPVGAVASGVARGGAAAAGGVASGGGASPMSWRGVMTLPKLLLILTPFSSSTKPCVTTL